MRERIKAYLYWLLILDNTDDLALFRVGGTQLIAETHNLYDFVPRGPIGTVL